jgi:hypothetical protein
VNDEVIDFLIQTCRGIRVLNLTDCSQISGNFLFDTSTTRAPFTHSLALFPGEKVQLLLRNNPSLLALNLHGVPGLTDATITCLQESCSNLEVLIVWKDISENALSQLNMSNLTALDLSNCKNLKVHSFFLLLVPVLTSPMVFCENCSSQLQLPRSSILATHSLFSRKQDKALSDLVRNNTLLKHFNIAGCEVTEKSLLRMEKDRRNFINLLSLVADSCFHLPSSSFLQLTSHCRHLRTLSLAGNTQSPLSITDETIVTISTHLGSSLQEINLYRNFQLTDKAVVAIAHHCTQLSAISLAHCKVGLTTSLIPLVLSRSYYHHLTFFTSKGITDAAVIELAKSSATLTVVNLTNTGITDKPVRLLVRKHPKLQTLILEWCQKVGDKAVRSIIKHGKFIGKWKSRQGHLPTSTSHFPFLFLQILTKPIFFFLSTETLALTGLFTISDEVLLQLGHLSETLVFLEVSWLKKPPSVISLLRSRLPNTKVGAGEFRSNMSSTFLRIGW